MKNRVNFVFFEVINSSVTPMFSIVYAKITLHHSVYVHASGEKVLISDEAERAQSVSYPHIKSLSGLYTVMGAIRWGTRGTRPPHFFRQWGYNMSCTPHFSV